MFCLYYMNKSDVKINPQSMNILVHVYFAVLTSVYLRIVSAELSLWFGVVVWFGCWVWLFGAVVWCVVRRGCLVRDFNRSPWMSYFILPFLLFTSSLLTRHSLCATAARSMLSRVRNYK